MHIILWVMVVTGIACAVAGLVLDAAGLTRWARRRHAARPVHEATARVRTDPIRRRADRAARRAGGHR